MLPASNKGAGMNMGFPDVCLTPAAPSPIPIPYPNMGMHATAAPFCPTILLTMVPALNMGSIIPMTMGDEAGVANPFFKQMGMFVVGNPKVILQGLPAITMSCPTTGNNMNNAVGAVTVPAATNVMYTYASTDPLDDRNPVTVTDAGVIVISVFSQGVAASVHSAVRKLAARGISRLVFDVRDNPGGEMAAAVELLRDFLAEGAVIATAIDGDEDATTFCARGDAYPYPITVMVNAKTASAAELFAGALKAHGRATVVGKRTYGKGVARALVNGEMVDVARIVLSSGEEIHGIGITPDIEES